jgi:hypothetical protein
MPVSRGKLELNKTQILREVATMSYKVLGVHITIGPAPNRLQHNIVLVAQNTMTQHPVKILMSTSFNDSR